MEEKYQRMIDYMNTVDDFNAHNGIRLVEVRDDYASCRVDMDEHSLNPQGITHGGLLFAMCDFVAGYAVLSTDRPMVTQSSSFNFLRPGTGSYLFAEGLPVKVGAKTAVVDGLVYDDQHRLLAKGTFTYFFI
ncbi:MAG: PaaI family thioesterase [Oscillospiraceae bacterium]